MVDMGRYSTDYEICYNAFNADPFLKETKRAALDLVNLRGIKCDWSAMAAEQERRNQSFIKGLESLNNTFGYPSQTLQQPNTTSPTKSVDLNCRANCISRGNSFNFCNSDCSY